MFHLEDTGCSWRCFTDSLYIVSLPIWGEVSFTSVHAWNGMNNSIKNKLQKGTRVCQRRKIISNIRTSNWRKNKMVEQHKLNKCPLLRIPLSLTQRNTKPYAAINIDSIIPRVLIYQRLHQSWKRLFFRIPRKQMDFEKTSKSKRVWIW